MQRPTMASIGHVGSFVAADYILLPLPICGTIVQVTTNDLV